MMRKTCPEGFCTSLGMLDQNHVKEDKSFDVFLTVHHSIDLFHLPTLMHNSFFL